MRNVRLRLSYDGSRFYGWQRQDGFESVQEAVEDAFGALVGERVVVRGAGRTDTGVHALGQVANAHVDTRLEDERLLFALNAHLPPGVAVERLETCRPDFHAQYDARGKRYAYLVSTRRVRSPFPDAYRHWVREPLDRGAMERAARVLVGEHDFRAFASSGSPRKSTVRTVSAVRIVARRERLAFVVQGTGFLYNQVRTMAGTLLDVGRGKLGPEDVEAILASGERSRAGPTAPPGGLYLVRVLYDETMFPADAAGGRRRAAGVF